LGDERFGLFRHWEDPELTEAPNLADGLARSPARAPDLPPAVAMCEHWGNQARKE
jgi:hypothetical protein